MNSMNVLGIMSGTSMDGVDYALCSCSSDRVRLRSLWHVAFPLKLRARLHAAARGDADSWELAQLHHDLGRFYALHARAKAPGASPRLVGVHGQTFFHHPDRKAPASFQLGEPAYLAETLRVPVVSNFRAADLAAGGQGAPLATQFHVRVFGQRGRHVCVNNLGGISNVTSIDWRRGARPHVRAFDTGPANVLLDLAMRHFSKGRLAFDRGGAWARQGTACKALLQAWLQHPFFGQAPPKSTGRELFGEPFFQAALREARRFRLSGPDLVATFNALTARSLVKNYQMHLASRPDDVVLAGGGVANGALVQNIRKELEDFSPATRVRTSVELGWPAQSVEPAAFALLAWLRVGGEAGNLPETTGARRAVLCGQISAGASPHTGRKRAT